MDEIAKPVNGIVHEGRTFGNSSGWTPSKEEAELRANGGLRKASPEELETAWAAHETVSLSDLASVIKKIQSGAYDELLYMLEYAIRDRKEYIASHALEGRQTDDAP